MDLFKNATSAQRSFLLAASAVAFGTGYYYYSSRMSSQTAPAPIVTKGVVVLIPHGSQVTGTIHFEQKDGVGPVTVKGDVKGLSPNAKRGFHVHQWGDLTNGCDTAGAHYNPFGALHGGPHSQTRHVGDLGNIQSNDRGEAKFEYQDHVISLNGITGIIGRAVVVHAGEDDLGQGGHEDSHTTGHAGGRAACGVIGIAEQK